MSKGCWVRSSDATRWDELLASRNAHPLQSALWGDSRQETEGIEDLRLEHQMPDGSIDGLARIETRWIPVLGKVAWLPKVAGLSADLEKSLRAELKHLGFIACISDMYHASDTNAPARPKTIWLDLSVGLEALAKTLDSRVRYSARRAQREGVVVRTSTARSDVSAFFRLCNALSKTKGFALPGSEALMRRLISSSSPDGAVGMSLYVSDVDGEIAGSEPA